MQIQRYRFCSAHFILCGLWLAIHNGATHIAVKTIKFQWFIKLLSKTLPLAQALLIL